MGAGRVSDSEKDFCLTVSYNITVCWLLEGSFRKNRNDAKSNENESSCPSLQDGFRHQHKFRLGPHIFFTTGPHLRWTVGLNGLPKTCCSNKMLSPHFFLFNCAAVNCSSVIQHILCRQGRSFSLYTPQQSECTLIPAQLWGTVLRVSRLATSKIDNERKKKSEGIVTNLIPWLNLNTSFVWILFYRYKILKCSFHLPLATLVVNLRRPYSDKRKSLGTLRSIIYINKHF